MPVELEMPELAESVIEGEIVKWLVKEGDHVAMDQLIVEVMTDKVTVEVPSPYEGILLKQVAKEGDVVPIGKPIAIFGNEGETLEGHDGGEAEPTEKITPEKVVVVEEKPAQKQPPNGQAVTAEPKPAPAAAEEATVSAFGRPMAAPAVRKLARELGVDLNRVKGSGDGGRIRREDVKRVAESGPEGGRAEGPAAKGAAAQARAPQQDERIPLRGLRRVIADHMAHSKH